MDQMGKADAGWTTERPASVDIGPIGRFLYRDKDNPEPRGATLWNHGDSVSATMKRGRGALKSRRHFPTIDVRELSGEWKCIRRSES